MPRRSRSSRAGRCRGRPRRAGASRRPPVPSGRRGRTPSRIRHASVIRKLRLRAASTLSSTTSTRERRPAAPPAAVATAAGGVPTGPGSLASSVGGRRTRSPCPPLRSGHDRAAVHLDERPASVRPIPRPPCERSSEPSAWVKRSKIRGRSPPRRCRRRRPGRGPRPRRPPAGCSARLAARLGVLRGVRQQVREHLFEPRRVGVEPDRLGGESS